MAESSLKQYLLDQQTDPVETQLNQIKLEMVKALDRNRISDQTKYNLEQTVRSGQHIGFSVQRVPDIGEIKQVVVPNNVVPNAMRVGETLYRQFTFDPIKTLPKVQPSKLTFTVPDNTSQLSKGFMHKQDVSIRDQQALDGIRKKQLGEEIEKIQKLAKKQPESFEAVQARSNISSQHIANLANPLNVVHAPLPPPAVTRDLENLRYDANLEKFNVAVPKQKLSTRRRRKSLTIDTNIDRSIEPYNYDLWTYKPEEYIRNGELIQTTSIPWDDSGKVLKYLKEYWQRPAHAGTSLLEANPRIRSADIESRKSIVFDRRKKPRVEVTEVAGPSLSETTRRVSQRVRAALNRPPERAVAISQNKTQYRLHLDQYVGRTHGAKLTKAMKKDLLDQVQADYGQLVSPDTLTRMQNAVGYKGLYSAMYNFTKKHTEVTSDLNPRRKKGKERAT